MNPNISRILFSVSQASINETTFQITPNLSIAYPYFPLTSCPFLISLQQYFCPLRFRMNFLKTTFLYWGMKHENKKKPLSFYFILFLQLAKKMWYVVILEPEIYEKKAFIMNYKKEKRKLHVFNYNFWSINL